MPKTFFFYGDQQIEVDHDTLSGSAIKETIKAKNPTVDLGHDLVLEGHGHESDRVIPDGENVELSHGHGEGPKRFFLRPPTSFGDV